MANARRERGNVFFMILLGVALFAALSLALARGAQNGKSIDGEKSALVAEEILRYAREVKDATTRLYTNGVSEADIRFAHPALANYGDITATPAYQVFSETGGGMTYKAPPASATTSTATWEFLGDSSAPQVGIDDVADLMIVLPNVKETVCRKINEKIGYPKGSAFPTDSTSAKCPASTWYYTGAGFATGGNRNVIGTTNFRLPGYQACVLCNGTYQFYSVLLER